MPEQRQIRVPRKSSTIAKGVTSVSQPPAGAPRQMSGACRGVQRQRQVRNCSTVKSASEPVPIACKPASRSIDDIFDAPCRNCGKSFKRLPKHLIPKPECMAMYPEYNKEERRRQLNREAQKRSESKHRDEVRQRSWEGKKRLRAKNPQQHRRKHAKNTRLLRQTKISSLSQGDRFKAFKEDIRDGWVFVCICCLKRFFKKGVVSLPQFEGVDIYEQLGLLKKEMEKIRRGLFDKCIDENFFLSNPSKMTYGNKIWLCHTCWNGHLKKGKMPPQSSKNGLTCEKIPRELILNDLETTLIAKRILFMKISKLPVSRWSTFKDRTVNILIGDEDIIETVQAVNSLPRSPDQACLIPVQLKRKKIYQNKVLEAFIDPEKLVTAILKLKELGHPGYQEIDINEDFIESARQAAAALFEESDTDEETDGESDQEEDVGSTFMTEKFPESSVVVNTGSAELKKKRSSDSKNSFSIAPGEGKVPTSLMRDKTWDVDAFPNLHPSGSYGLYCKRPVPLSDQK